MEKTLVLSVDELLKLTSYAHWIPILNGLHQDFIAKSYPGWEWNHIIPVLIKKGVVNIHSKDLNQRMLAQGLSIAHDVESVLIKRSKHGTRIKVHKVATS